MSNGPSKTKSFNALLPLCTEVGIISHNVLSTPQLVSIIIISKYCAWPDSASHLDSVGIRCSTDEIKVH